MTSIRSPHPAASRLGIAAFLSCLVFGLSSAALAAPPDLTNGGVPTNSVTINLGPTGMRGWVYHKNGSGTNTSESRQIQVKSVATGSPAAGILAVDDVILGADGTGAEPVNFSSDARKSLALAIADAEARTPATLKLLVWRSGTTSTKTITLRTMGAYSATAPYNCPKSAQILEEGLQYIMSSETSGRYSFGAMSLLAANNPANPNNAARMARVQAEARALIPSASAMAKMMVEPYDTGRAPWQRGHELVFLSEYYLVTGDTQVLPAIRAYAVNIANNTSLFGTLGHIFAEPWPDGSPNGPMGGGYGPVNSAGMPCFLGLLLAKECGITDPEIVPGIERASRFFAYYANKGAIPYGEHEPGYEWHESNGKSGLAALAFGLQSNRVNEGKFFARMATAATSEREEGHTGAFFNYLWSPLGAATGGEQAAAAHFSGISWMLDLNRKWNGGFDYDCLYGQGPNSGASYNEFNMSTAALLVYALPLRQLHVTGRGHDSGRWLTPTEVSEAVAADGYDAAPRSVSQLVADLGSWSPKVQKAAAEQLATRTVDEATVNQIIGLATDPNGTSRPGACLALGKISHSASAATRAATLAGLLTDPQNHVRFMAAEGMRYLGTSNKMAHLNTILAAAASTAGPLYPMNEEDPLHMAHGRLAMLLFYGGTAYGPTGILSGSNVTSAPKNLLYPAIEAVAGNPIGICRSTLESIYPYLTQDDLNAVSGALVDMIRQKPPADRMFSAGARVGAIETMQKYGIAEGVPLSIEVMKDDGRTGTRTDLLAVLENYAGSSNTVVPDPNVDAFCLDLISRGSFVPEAQAVLDAIAADTNPAPLTAFKTIQSVTADKPAVTLPVRHTMLRVTSNDHANGDSVYTWRKLYGAGNVSFTPNGTADSRNTTVLFDGIPGKYLFEVKMSDSRKLTEITSTVEVTLYQTGGTLPPNNPPVATSQSPTVVRAIPTPIILTGTDPEGLPLNFTVTTNPAHGTLTGTAPYLVYTSDLSYTGSDNLTFQVQDSEGQTSLGTVYINVTDGSVPTAIYEPFNYPAGSLNGASGASEVGFNGPWSANTNSNVVNGSLSYGGMPTVGRSIGNDTGNLYGGKRAISSSALAATGLLNDGATLWFSAIVGYGNNPNLTNGRLTLALANSNFSTSNYQYYIVNEGAQLGSGIGLTLGDFGDSGGNCVATHFRDSSFGTSGFSGNVFGTVPSSMLVGNQHRLVVGKITWGAASDTIQLYEPYPDLTLGSVKSTLTVNVDQSTFDTITWARSSAITMDEIRFGPNYASVLAGNAPMTADTTPPEPGPMAFLKGPAVASTSSISMSAVTAYDPNGVEYYFTCTAGGGHDSGWQSSPNYTDTGLTPGVAYSYTVMARDKSPARNQTAASPAASATIGEQTPVPPVVGMIDSSAQSVIANAGLVVGTVTTVNDPNSFAGTVLSQTPAGDTFVALGTTVDLVVSLGPLPDANPPVIASADFVDDKGGAAVLLRTPITYTLTFSEDIDASTVSAADFGNAGTSTVTIGTVTEISHGVFTVQATPTKPGTVQLRINAGAVINDMSGNALDTTAAIADDTTITVNPLTGTGPVIYEPFDMAVGPLKSQAAGLGLNGSWLRHAGSDTNQFVVSSPGMSYGTLPITGNRTKNGVTGGTRGNNIPFSSQLVNRGLLADGATLWFSVLVEPVVSANAISGFALASGSSTSTVSTSSNSANVNGIGINMANGSDLQYFMWKAGSPSGTTQSATAQSDLHNIGGTNQGFRPHLVVGRIVWGSGGANDTFELFMPDSNLNQGSRKGSLQSVNLDQSTFNRVVVYDSSNGIQFDEIRVGPSYESVVGVNTAPAWAANPVTVTNANEDSAYSATLASSVSDADVGDTLTFAKLSGPAWLTVAADGKLSGTPSNSDVGTNSFTVSVTDRLSAPVTATLNITVTNSNDAPEWTANPIAGGTANEDSAYSGSLAGIATDVDTADTLTYVKISGPAWVTVGADGTLSGTPSNSDVGNNAIIVGVTDGILPPIAATLNIAVANTNDDPVWSGNPLAGTDATEDAAYSATLAGSASDEDSGATLSFAKISGPAWLGVASNGALTGTPANGDVGLNTFTVSVTDGIVATPVETTLNITVINTNDAPAWTANPVTGASATEDSAYSGSIAANAIDADAGATLTFAKVSGPAWLSVASDGVLSGTPTNDDVGNNTFTVSVTDGIISSPVQATLNITVTNSNDAPFWTLNPITGAKAAIGLAYSGTLDGLADDLDPGDTLTYAKVSGPAWLTVASNGNLSGTPATGDLGLNTFTVSVSDGTAAPVEATLEITVALSWFWDGGTTDITADGNAASNGGNGSWNASLKNWDVGTSPHVNWVDSEYNTAIFGGTAGIVTVVSTRNVGGVLFQTTGYTLNSGTLALAPTTTFTTSSGFTCTVASKLTGQGSSLVKAGGGTLVLSNATSDFTGSVRVSGGLSIASIADGGVASPLGMSSSAASNLVLNSGTTLTYTGGTASSNRSFTLNGSSVTINANGSGPLTLSSTAPLAYGSPNQARTLTLTGANNLSNTHRLDAQITDNGTGVVSLVKTGTGSVWWLTNPNNTFTGDVRYNRGFLVFSKGALGTGGKIILDANPVPPLGLRWAPGNDEDISSRFNSTSSGSGMLTLDTGANDVVFANAIWQAGGTWIIKEGTGSLTLNAASTWGSSNGATLINKGTLVARVLANGGASSSVGNTDSAASRLGLRNAALKYTGTGATTDRNFHISGSNTIDASGTGALVFSQTGVISPTPVSRNFALTSGSPTTGNAPSQISADLVPGMAVSGTGIPANTKIASIGINGQLTFDKNATVTGTQTLTFGSYAAGTLTLTGSNTGANEIKGILRNSVSNIDSTTTTLSLAKTGPGQWVLSGANTYTGATTVSEGTLALIGGSTASPITVTGGASLRFALGSPVASTSSVNLVSGTVKITGTPTLTSHTLMTAAGGFTGTPVLDVPIAGYELVVEGTELKLIKVNIAPAWTGNPVVEADAAEDMAYVSTLADDVTDINGDPLAFVKIDGPAWLNVAADGTLSGTPSNSDVGTNVFTVSVSDGTAAPVEATLQITVLNTNDAPVWTSNPLSGPDVNEDTVFTMNLAEDATDVDAGASLTFAKVSGPGWLNIDPTGSVSGIPANGDVGVNSFTVSVSDGVDSPVETTLNITVINTNDAPVFAANPITGADATEDAAYSGSLAGTASDADTGAILSYAKVSGPAWLNVAADGTLSGTPANDDVGANVFTVSVSDGASASAQATLNITVDNTNDAPVFVSNPVNGVDATEDAAYSGSLAGSVSDADTGATLTFAKLSGPAWLTVAPDGTFAGTPANEDVGANSFAVSVSDGIAPAVEATLNITVVNTNDAPVFAASPIIGVDSTEDAAYSGSIAGSASDADNDGLTYAKVVGPAWLVVAADGTLAGTPGNDDVGLNVFTVSVSDGIAAAVEATLNITVINTNDTPVAVAQSVTTAEDAAYPITLAGTDVDQDTLTYTIVTQPANGTLSGTAPNLAYTPAENFNGADSFTFIVNDGTVDSAEATVSVSVTPVNDAPVASAQSVTTAEDSALPITLTGSDVDPDTLTYTIVTQPANGTLSGTAPNLAYTPAENFNGADSFTFIVNDGTVDSAEATVSVSVTPVNDAPVFAINPMAGANATEDAAYSGSISGSASDVDAGAVLTYAKVSGPAWLFVASNGTLSGTPASGDIGANSFTVSVSDGIESPVNATLNIVVVAAPDTTAPTPNPMTFAVAPVATGTTSIVMTATTATDTNGVEYYFACTSGGGHDSGWQDSPTYTDTDLAPATLYSYTVMARDKSANQNSTTPSAPASATTLTPVPSIRYWDGGNTDIVTNGNGASAGGGGTWNTTLLNWDAGNQAHVAWSNLPNDTAVFGGTAGTVTLATGVTVGGLKFDTANYTLSGGTVTFGLAGNIEANANATISSVIAGNVAITKTGNGVLTLSGANTYTGATSVPAGILDLTNVSLAGFGGGSGRNISVAGGAGVRRNALDNAFLNRLTETTAEITVMTGTTSNPIDFGSSTGADLPNAFLGNWIGNGAKVEYSGTLTPASDAYRLGGKGSNGLLAFVGTNKLTGTQGLLVGGTGGSGIRVMLAGANDFSGDTVINTGAKLTLANNLALQNSALNVGAAGGNFALNSAGSVTGALASPSPTFGGLIGSRNLLSVFTNAGGNNESNLASTAVTGFTLNVGTGRTCVYTGNIANFAPGTTLTKTGPGTQVLGGANTYTGATTVAAGTLEFLGGIHASPITVAAGASLGLTLGSTTTSSSSVDLTNGTVKVSGTPNLDTYILMTANGGFIGSPVLAEAVPGYALVVQGTSLKLMARSILVPVWNTNPVVEVNATEDGPYYASLAEEVTDPNGDALAFAKLSGPAWLNVAPDGTLSGTPLNADVGANSFTVAVTDGDSAPVMATLSIAVVNTNDAPVFAMDPIAGPDATEDAAFSGSIAGSASDVDAGATLTYAKISGPAWLTVGSNGALSGTPANGDVGANSFTVSVSDGIAAAVETTLNITVINANDAPTWASNPITGVNANEDSAYSGSLAGSASDPDAGATLTFAKVNGPAWLSVASNGALSGTPANNDVGSNSFTVSVSDGIAAAVTTTLNITVINSNDAPVFTTNPIIAAGATAGIAYTGQTLAGQATDADAGDTITYSKVSGPAWLVIAPDGALSGTPPSGSAGLNSFVVRASDGASATADATLQITVAGLPLPWISTDIGTGMLAGSATHNAGTFTQAGSGVIGSTSDKLRFTYQTLSGDGEIIARISSLQDTGTSSRVGVMIRDTLAANSKQIFMGMTGSNAYRWTRRTTTGGSTSSNNSSTGTVPNTWVRLVRSGTTITAYKSTNGTSWTTVGSTTNTTFAATCYIGLAVGSGSDATLNTSQFSNVTVTP